MDHDGKLFPGTDGDAVVVPDAGRGEMAHQDPALLQGEIQLFSVKARKTGEYEISLGIGKLEPERAELAREKLPVFRDGPDVLLRMKTETPSDYLSFPCNHL